MNEVAFEKDKYLKLVEEVLGTYRAEWAGDDLFRHFTRPSYFYALEAFRPCVLQGGRGSGKTTALKGLSYLGQFSLHNSDVKAFDNDVGYIGLYHCFNTTHVRAFKSSGVSELRWQRYFGHYFNLLVVQNLAMFLKWHKTISPDDECLSHEDMMRVLSSLGLKEMDVNEYGDFVSLIEQGLYKFQEIVNNIQYWDQHQDRVFLSHIGNPVLVLMSQILKLRVFSRKRFFIIIDEYENLEDYQQIVLNTMIKHSSEIFTFKIGVRELGWRVKHTLNEEEILYDPADYALLDIKESFAHGEDFKSFAKNVCKQRFEALLGEGSIDEIENLFPGMSPEQEAIALGVMDHELMRQFESLPDQLQRGVAELNALYRFGLAYWADVHDLDLAEVVLEYMQSPEDWDDRMENYKVHLLFKIRGGRGSGPLQKYYSGFDTYVMLASCNIRFLMELVHDAYVANIEEGFGPLDKISEILQTKAAKALGLRRLTQVESECVEGSRIVRLMSGMGRVFERLAKEFRPAKPEVTQFECADIVEGEELKHVLEVAIKNSALERSAGNKLSGNETRFFDYNIHPIFAPHFCFSYRRKRKMRVPAAALRSMLKNPDDGLRMLFGKSTYDSDSSELQLTFDFGM